MQVFDFIRPDELAELPEDARSAFAEFSQITYQRLMSRIEAIDAREDGSYGLIGEAKRAFMNVVLAAAKRYEIFPLSDFKIPSPKNFNEDSYDEFKAELDFYLTQIMIDNSIRERRDSFPIDLTSREKIRNYVAELRNCIDKAELPDADKARLHERLDAFEALLNQRRVSLLKVTAIIFNIIAIPGAVWASAEIVGKLTTNVIQLLAQAKAADESSRKLAPVEKPKELAPPVIRASAETRSFGRSKSVLDDDIPF